jgi:alkylation response protein AidB-like acyl-CoA dehydrogenase
MEPTLSPSWFAEQFNNDPGALQWALPRAFGGEELDPLALHLRYEQLARRSLESALLLTQRDSAVGIIDASPNQPARARLLDEVRQGAAVTVGIAQLTTSHQRGKPALTAQKTAHGWRIEGLIPWVTGAIASTYIIAGAACEREQILFALPTALDGVTVKPPLPLATMAGTLTSAVQCVSAELPADLLLLGPAENALSLRRKSVPLPQAFLALGHCRGAVDLIAEHRSERARTLRDRFSEQIEALHARVLTACGPGSDLAAIPRIRGKCNELALRITHAAVALYKGSSLLVSHPAQRLAREALFLLVWSCPDPVIDCTVELLSEPRSAHSAEHD